MKYIYIDKKTKLIKMESKKKMDLPQFDIAKITDEDLNGCVSYFKDGKVIKEKTAITIKEEAKEELKTATTIEDLKKIINKLI